MKTNEITNESQVIKAILALYAAFIESDMQAPAFEEQLSAFIDDTLFYNEETCKTLLLINGLEMKNATLCELVELSQTGVYFPDDIVDKAYALFFNAFAIQLNLQELTSQEVDALYEKHDLDCPMVLNRLELAINMQQVGTSEVVILTIILDTTTYIVKSDPHGVDVWYKIRHTDEA